MSEIGNSILDIDVPPPKKRRKFTADYKSRILSLTDACSHGHLGGLLHQEGLYRSNIAVWRRQQEIGVLLALTPKKRGRIPRPKKTDEKKLAQLLKENQKIQKKLEKFELIIKAQKKFL